MRLDLQLAGKLGEFAFDLQWQPELTGITGVFGPSGVGKTSLFRALCGLERSLQGRIELADQLLQDSASGHFVVPEKRRIGVVFQDSRLFPHLTVRQNLQLAARQAKRARWDLDQLAQACNFAELMEQPAPSLSAGQRQRVAIARAIAADPQLLLLDEPLAALDLHSRQMLLEFLQRTAEAIPMVFISHSVSETLQLCDRVALMEGGRIVEYGPTERLAAQLPRRRGHGRVVQYDKDRGQVTLQLDEFAPDFEPDQVVGLVGDPSWLKERS
ncbi:ATP-binding cassette domain-containing protein [Ferrimonas marina]|uniref:Molybdate transport system ATP-binding protein n=1 Tax=Ferrimonas marina TaxID=299255 RepID=A0A1M5XUZ5_9GAMM|nr:ATP-binding cassette domain-containing protein [Ferrimonas marina]SHI03532.1 molybdate transport system ATP-binding protein [Ferrimonas marina]